ncbi:helix-turn-helix transcriptional regulator [Tomitella cavernea]|uniref:helix-turn-helix transcriptional regulator n=1 Tax=Tomitella cavernea TaxID=1387982 RepID=UPI0027DB8DD2|nr:response regulator transcription factor [Tomitella cavernea]
MGGIRVALVDDYEVVVRGLAVMLRTYGDRVEVVELDANTRVDGRVDIALYDSFANPQGDRSQVRALAANPLVDKVAVYSWNLDALLVESAFANGASGYVAKSLPARQLVVALEEVHRGVRQVHAGVPGTRVVVGDWPGREEGLTQREAEVLALITQGLSNSAIAEHAHLSINSVKTYIRNCYRRIGVTSRAQAVLWGVEHGFRPDRARIPHPPQVPGVQQ